MSRRLLPKYALGGISNIGRMQNSVKDICTTLGIGRTIFYRYIMDLGMPRIGELADNTHYYSHPRALKRECVSRAFLI